jgi:hypothetical protein
MNFTDLKKIIWAENAKIEQKKAQLEKAYNFEIAHNKGKGHRVKALTKGKRR